MLENLRLFHNVSFFATFECFCIVSVLYIWAIDIIADVQSSGWVDNFIFTNDGAAGTCAFNGRIVLHNFMWYILHFSRRLV